MWSGGDHSGKLTVQNVYTEITHTLWHTNIKGRRKHLWTWLLPSKIKFFTWLMIAYKLNTQDILQRKGWTGPNIFHLCYNNVESADPYSSSVHFPERFGKKLLWCQILNHLGTGQLSDFFDSSTHREHKLKHLTSLVCWSIWLEKIFFFFRK